MMWEPKVYIIMMIVSLVIAAWLWTYDEEGDDE